LIRRDLTAAQHAKLAARRGYGAVRPETKHSGDWGGTGKEERRGVRPIFQPTFGFNGGLERSAGTRFRGCRFGSLSQSLVSQLPVRLITINRAQGEHKGRRRVSIGNTLTAEVSFSFVVPKGHSLKSGAPLVFCRESSGVHSSRASADRRRVSSGMSHQSLPFGGRQIAPRVGLELAASYCRSEMFRVSSLIIVRRAPSL
jgi:hypothetical protein